MNNLFSLQGRMALVTGGSRGIGQMIAEGFLRHGAKVYISARKAEACDRAAAELSAIGPCISLPIDVSSVDGARRWRPRSGARAAAGHPGQQRRRGLGREIRRLSRERLGQGDGPEPEGAVLPDAGTARALKAARAERPAKVINIASIDGISVNPQETYSYAASKAGLIHLTKRMALRLTRTTSSSAGSRRARLPRHERARATTATRSPSASRLSASAATKTWPAPRSSWLRGRATMWWALPSWSMAASRSARSARRAELSASQLDKVGTTGIAALRRFRVAKPPVNQVIAGAVGDFPSVGWRRRIEQAGRLQFAPQPRRHRLIGIGRVGRDLHWLRGPSTTETTAGCAIANCNAARRIDVPCAAQIASILRTRSMISGGAAAYSNLAPARRPWRGSRN